MIFSLQTNVKHRTESGKYIVSRFPAFFFRSLSFCSEDFKSKGRRTRKESRGITINILFAFSAPLLVLKDASRKLRDAFGKTKIQACL
jgi:hypothetical protein